MKTLLSWSSGKDSAWCLHKLRQNKDIDLVGLVTTVNERFDRVAMHGVRHALIKAQAQAAGLPLHIIKLPHPCSNEIYEQRMGTFVETQVKAGIEAMAFGDLFLEDIRTYREEKLKGTGLQPLFPLFGSDTTKLASEMQEGGLRAQIVCLDPKTMPRSMVGLEWNRQLLEKLPQEVDPCGENGEFHTFAFAGPMFGQPIDFSSGETVERDGFMFADLLTCNP